MYKKDVQEDRITQYSDLQMKKPYINKCLHKVGLKFGNPAAQAAYAAGSSMLYQDLDPGEVFSRPGTGRLKLFLVKNHYPVRK